MKNADEIKREAANDQLRWKKVFFGILAVVMIADMGFGVKNATLLFGPIIIVINIIATGRQTRIAVLCGLLASWMVDRDMVVGLRQSSGAMLGLAGTVAWDRLFGFRNAEAEA